MTINFTCKLAGLSYRPAEIKEIVAKLEAGQPLQLVRDPANKYDTNAVKVMHGDVFIGFLPAAVSRDMMTMGKGFDCVVHAPQVHHEPPILEITGTGF